MEARRPLLATLWVLSLCVPMAVAQPLTIVRTNPEEGATHVADTKRVEFHLNKPLPDFGSQFAQKFTWSPRRQTSLSTFGHDWDDDGDLTTIFFVLEHEPATDVSFIAFGVEAADGSKMERPVVLNYTTATSQGTNTIDGSVAFGERSLSSESAVRQTLESVVRRAALGATVSLDSDQVSHLTKSRDAGKTRTSSVRLAVPQELRRTVVLLLDRYTFDPARWAIRKAVVPSEDGEFSFTGIRDGAYWPVAINFATDEGEAIGSYGFYDSDGDLEPDAIEVQNGSVTDLELVLYSASPTTARINLALADELADQSAPDQQLVNIMALQGPALWEAYADGTAEMWRYTYFSPSESRKTYVAIDPVNVYLDTEAVSSYDAHPLPELFLDTDELMDIANQNGGDAFRVSHPDEEIAVRIEGGDLPLSSRPDQEVFWMVVYEAGNLSTFDADTVFVDMESGNVLEEQPISSESPAAIPAYYSLMQNYPNPFNPTTRIPFEIMQSARVRLTIVNALGKEVAQLLDDSLIPGSYSVAWEPNNLPSGTYYCRMTVNGRVSTRSMVFAK